MVWVKSQHSNKKPRFSAGLGALCPLFYARSVSRPVPAKNGLNPPFPTTVKLIRCARVVQRLRNARRGKEMNNADPDLLFGIQAIASHLGIEYRQAAHIHEQGGIPTFKMGKIVCARRSTLAKHFAEQEAASPNRPSLHSTLLDKPDD